MTVQDGAIAEVPTLYQATVAPGPVEIRSGGALKFTRSFDSTRSVITLGSPVTGNGDIRFRDNGSGYGFKVASPNPDFRGRWVAESGNVELTNVQGDSIAVALEFGAIQLSGSNPGIKRIVLQGGDVSNNRFHATLISNGSMSLPIHVQERTRILGNGVLYSPISGSGELTISNNGNQPLSFSGSNSFSGNLLLDGGP